MNSVVESLDSEKINIGTHRGHLIEEAANGKWVYSDNKVPVLLLSERDCGQCGKPYTSEGHDGCLGTLKGCVMNACCGHGSKDDVYVQFWDGLCVRGEDASIMLEILKKWTEDENLSY